MKPLADMMAKDSKCRWGNYFSSINFPISISLEKDPLLYLSKAKSAIYGSKKTLTSSSFGIFEYRIDLQYFWS